MKTIEIDDELFGYLQSKAMAFVETPNLTLRRLLLGDKSISSQNSALTTYQNKKKTSKPRKQPKTNLLKLIESGLLKEGQVLYLYDYQGNKIKGYEAIISGKSLLWNNELFSMSELAKELLKEVGFSSESVRGPAFWHNSDGISVKNLWKQYLNQY
jgi:negative regulator of replication initiation